MSIVHRILVKATQNINPAVFMSSELLGPLVLHVLPGAHTIIKTLDHLKHAVTFALR